MVTLGLALLVAVYPPGHVRRYRAARAQAQVWAGNQQTSVPRRRHLVLRKDLLALRRPHLQLPQAPPSAALALFRHCPPARATEHTKHARTLHRAHTLPHAHHLTALALLHRLKTHFFAARLVRPPPLPLGLQDSNKLHYQTNDFLPVVMLAHLEI
ncbi:hypothetical protein DFH11DRAFT_1724704 [Phellopilus nigrolimitatus]|nr:hypothetical protein DFH11DRAFT_1724704 [Phellopilus nigrolimitatus]